jgi:mono/diheme cytochrome c family protein
MDFNLLYKMNCAGCHGDEGKGAGAIGLGDPVYLAIAADATISRVTANGVPGTAMPPFAQSSGGMLSTEQIDAIVTGIRSHWAKPDLLRGENPPPYSMQARGDPMRGANVFAAYCSSCHGAAGRGGPKASSIVDGSYLALVIDTSARLSSPDDPTSARQTGAAMRRASLCRRKMSSMLCPGSVHSGANFLASLTHAHNVWKEDFNDAAWRNLKTRNAPQARALF